MFCVTVTISVIIEYFKTSSVNCELPTNKENYKIISHTFSNDGNSCGSESIQLNAKKLTKKFEYISRNTPAIIAECMRDYFVIFFVCG